MLLKSAGPMAADRRLRKEGGFAAAISILAANRQVLAVLHCGAAISSFWQYLGSGMCGQPRIELRQRESLQVGAGGMRRSHHGHLDAGRRVEGGDLHYV